jgi:hypothetical protein
LVEIPEFIWYSGTNRKSRDEERKKMATKKEALMAIEAAGVELDRGMAELGNYTLDAPAGRIFLANGEPSYLAGVYDREEIKFGGPKISEIYDDIVMACLMGTEVGEGSE